MPTAKFIENKRIQDKAKLDLSILRSKRSKLLKAFDIYKLNVMYNADPSETPEEHATVMLWYITVLDLSHPEAALAALENPPEKITKYL